MSVRIIPAQNLPACTSKADTRPHPIPLAWHLMLDAGLRVGETIKLAWCDLVYRGVPLAGIEITTDIGKGGRARHVPINSTLATAIVAAWTEAHDRRNMTPANYALAKSPNANALTVRTIERAVLSIGRQVNGLKVTPHMLRHTFATRLLKVTDLRTVQEALGHRKISTTEVYTHPSQDDLREALDRVSNAQILLTPTK